MDTLQATSALEFEMVYHVARGRFEKVVMHNCNSRDVLGQAIFTTTAPTSSQNRGGSPPATLARGAAAAQ